MVQDIYSVAPTKRIHSDNETGQSHPTNLCNFTDLIENLPAITWTGKYSCELALSNGISLLS